MAGFKALLALGRNAMIRSSGVACSVFISFVFALAVTLQSPRLCRAEQVGVIVPAYFYPGTGGPGGVGDGWAAMATAAAQIPVTAIFNPDSGPLPGPADPNYVTAMTNLENAGGKTVAYVYTGDGSVPAADVESEISTYITQYGSLIDGFFLDAMNVLPTTLSYYQSLDTFIKGLSSSYTVIGNSGQPFLNGVTPADYLTTADTINIFEGTNTGFPGFSSYPYGLNWFQSYSSSRFSNIIFNVPGTSLAVDLNKAVGLNAGYVFITDQTTPNPYAQLPSYWDQEVAAIGTVNAQIPVSVPAPSPLASALVLGSVIAFAAKGRLPLFN
jgi:hypothetical protein